MNKYTQLRGLPTRELKPLTEGQRAAYREQVRKYGLPQEEPLPEGASFRDPRVMNLVFRSMEASGVFN
jgi:hypothetical protein